MNKPQPHRYPLSAAQETPTPRTSSFAAVNFSRTPDTPCDQLNLQKTIAHLPGSVFLKQIDHNYCPSIIKDIQHVNFPRLKMLQLSQNTIRSIQALQYLKASNLSELHLSFNQIVEFKTLRKCSFPLLQKLSLMNNPIQLLDCLSEWNFPKLNMILLEDYRKMNVQYRILFKKHKFAKIYPPREVTISINMVIAEMTAQTKDNEPIVYAKLSKIFKM